MINAELKLKLLQETAKMPWTELQRFFASGDALYISPKLDLVDVGCLISIDETEVLEPNIKAGLITRVTDELAQSWYENNAILWTLVIRPWILVQPLESG